jgi:hypothetical protein
MILFVGQIERGMREREAFQELDYRAVFGTMTKWATEIDDAARIPEIISRAFHVATAGRPGPVVIALPEDVLTDLADVADAQPYRSPRRTLPCSRPSICRSGSGRRSRPSRSSAVRAGIRRRSRASSALPSASTCPSRSPSAGRCCSRPITRISPAISASAPIRSC